jgi:nucleoside phosphorylase
LYIKTRRSPSNVPNACTDQKSWVRSSDRRNRSSLDIKPDNNRDNLSHVVKVHRDRAAHMVIFFKDPALSSTLSYAPMSTSLGNAQGRRLRIEDYTVGWVCALPIELAAATEMLDEEHLGLPQDGNDTNLYTLGRIYEHNVVLACLPAGQMGTSSAAAVATQMKSRFASIRFGLMVGVGGGVPSAQSDIRLGDVVIGQPHMQHGGIVQDDFGKTGASGHLTRTSFLNAPPTVLLNALAKFRSNRYRGKSNLSVHLADINHLPQFAHDNAEPDILFKSTYYHVEGPTCDPCSKDELVRRTPRSSQDSVVHYGTIASGNQVMKDAVTRDRLSSELGGVLCFEMEAAGLMNSFPCLVIRGICDYADSHKNKRWQPYAAATAAACAKEILSIIPTAEVAKTCTVDEAIEKQHDLLCT